MPLLGQALAEESPGIVEQKCRLTAGTGNGMDSATENKPPEAELVEATARVKWRGKSSPRFWKQKRQCKPHLMQDQTEMNALLAHRFAAFRVGRWKPLATMVQEKWQPRLNANRTRLIATRFWTRIYRIFGID